MDPKAKTITTAQQNSTGSAPTQQSVTPVSVSPLSSATAPPVGQVFIPVPTEGQPINNQTATAVTDQSQPVGQFTTSQSTDIQPTATTDQQTIQPSTTPNTTVEIAAPEKPALNNSGAPEHEPTTTEEFLTKDQKATSSFIKSIFGKKKSSTPPNINTNTPAIKSETRLAQEAEKIYQQG